MTDATLRLDGPSARPLAALAPVGFGTPALWKGRVALEVQGGGPASALALGVALDLGLARLEAQPVIDLTSGAWRASASLRHPWAARLLGMLGVLVPPEISGVSDWLGEGSLSLMGQFSQTPAADGWGRLTADSFQVTAGSLRASGQLALDGRRISGTVIADALPVPLPDAASQSPLPVAALRGWQGAVHVQAAQIVAGPLDLLDHAAMTVALAGDVLSVEGLTGQLGNGTLSASASLNFGATPPMLSASGTLHDAAIQDTADDLQVGLLSGHLDGAADLVASGYSTAALLATLSGSLHASARDGALAGFDLFGAARAIGTADQHTPAETEQALRAALEAGTTSFDRFDLAGEATHGLLRLTAARLQGAAGSAQAEGSIGLTDGTLDVQVALAPSIPGSPVVGLRLDGLLTAPVRQPELAAATRWLTERQATR